MYLLALQDAVLSVGGYIIKEHFSFKDNGSRLWSIKDRRNSSVQSSGHYFNAVANWDSGL